MLASPWMWIVSCPSTLSSPSLETLVSQVLGSIPNCSKIEEALWLPCPDLAFLADCS